MEERIMIAFADEPGAGNGAPDTFEGKLRELADNVEALSKSITQQHLNAKNEWLHKVMSKYVPERVLFQALSKEEEEVEKAVSYLAQHKYEVQEHADGRCRVMRGAICLSEFKPVFKDGKVTYEQK